MLDDGSFRYVIRKAVMHMSATVTNGTELDTTTLADLLQRVEALEVEQSKQIKKKNKLTIIAWGGDLDQHLADDDPRDDRGGVRDGVQRLLHLLGPVRAS